MGRMRERHILDPVSRAMPHLYFEETENKVIGRVVQSSKFYTGTFRSFAYKEEGNVTAAKVAICLEFFDMYIREKAIK